MQITRLLLQDFRNYGHQEIRFSGGTNVFFGPNGAGKTNLIEAIYYLSTGRSFRTSRDKDLVKWNASGFYISADLELYGKSKRFAVNYSLDGSKRVAVDGKRVLRRQDGSAWLNAVVFSPQDLYIVKGPPSARRGFLDLLISRVSKTYARELWEYSRALNQRNALLRSGEGREEIYTIWEDKLATAGSRLVGERRRFLAEVSESASRYYGILVSGLEDLSMRYMVNCGDWEPHDLVGEAVGADLKALLLESLARNRAKEKRLGNTIVGPHRDDIALLVNAKDARVFGSQGQQRTAALSLRLAEVDLLTRTTGEPPILLLDDVISELDELRRSQLLGKAFSGGQVLITTTSLQDVLLWLRSSSEVASCHAEVFEVTGESEGPIIKKPRELRRPG